MADPRGPRLVVAAAGYGKTTALRRCYPEPAARWCRVTDPAALPTAERLAALAGGAGQLVLDGLPPLPPALAGELLDALAALPIPVAIASRWPLTPSPTRHTRPDDLRLTVAEVATLLRTEYGLPDATLPDRLHEATAGWPALVHLAAETLLTHPVPPHPSGLDPDPLLALLAQPGGLLDTYLRSEVIDPLPARTRRLLADLAGLAPVTPGLCAALDHADAGDQLRLLSRTGLLTPGPDPATAPRLVPLLAAVAVPPTRSRTCPARAAAYYVENGPPRAAARTLLAAGDADGCARVLAEHGDALVVTGRPRMVADLVAALPERLRGRRLRLLAGDALRVAGEVAAAAEAYESVARESTVDDRWDAGLAWRMGLVRYLRGNQAGALECYDRAARGPGGGEAVDRALLLAWRSVAVARLGDARGGVEQAWRAYRVAAGGGAAALATVHASLALCLGLAGDQVGSEEHHQLALGIAERTGDLVLLARLLTNQSYQLGEAARYPEALEAARRAIGYADAAGHANLRAQAAGNEAETLAALGRYDEAVDRYTQVLARFGRMGSRLAATALTGLGDVHRRRGWRQQARAAYAQALDLATGGDYREIAVIALAGLARTALPDDPALAAGHAAEAVRRATDELRVPALLAQGWTALAAAAGHPAAGDGPGLAVRCADEAVELARTAGRRRGLAEALELRAASAGEVAVAREALAEAAAIWEGAGAVVDGARVVVARSRLAGAGAEDRLAALVAVERLATAAVPVDDPGPGAADLPELRTLGRFEVLLGGQALPAAAWQSRRARDLLRILVVRRGRPVPRGELCELLWPDADPARTGHRLSVLLSIVRGVLDPGKARATDHYLVADAAAIALDVTHVRVDVLDFLAAVAHGRRLRDRGATAEARVVLAAAVRGYPADVFEDEPYDTWSEPLREQARAAYLAGLRMLADAHGTGTAAVDCLLRLLAVDRYDEAAHRALVRVLAAGGQHGEARRAFNRYRAAMREIGVRPPDPTVLARPTALAADRAGAQ
jgi:DNA-binding SARP family transcriptional activator/tetratricopeptide (TPR) repeat protein